MIRKGFVNRVYKYPDCTQYYINGELMVTVNRHWVDRQVQSMFKQVGYEIVKTKEPFSEYGNYGENNGPI